MPNPCASAPLLGQQDHAQSRTGNVFESGKVNDTGLRHCIDKRERCFALGCIQPPRDAHLAYGTAKPYGELRSFHCQPLLRRLVISS